MTPNEEFRAKNTRMAAVLQVGGFRPTLDPLATNLCRQPVSAAGEEWPLVAGAPLAFVAQLNLAQAPAVPELLRDIALITFFVNPDGSVLGRENGQNWVLRAYASRNGLTAMTPPPGAPKLGKGFECWWQAREDHPTHDDSERVAVKGARAPRSGFENVAQTKIGGYASAIQSEPWWGYAGHPAEPRYCLQVNSEPKAQVAWGDGGTIYIARGTAPGTAGQWFLDWQCF